MRRREFLGLIGGAAAASQLPAHAQQSGRQVGFLYTGPKPAAASRVTSFLAGLEAGGLARDKVTIIARVTDGDPTLLQPMAADLADRRVDLIAPLVRRHFALRGQPPLAFPS